MENNIYEPFSICFNMLKLRYKDYDDSLTEKDFLNPNDSINVFINLETVFKHLSMIQDLENKIITQKEFDTILTSNILNLAAHYKRFFVNNGLDTRIYLFHTDFASDEFSQFKYNEDFRSYYLVKFNSNPKFVLMTEHLTGQILPDVRTYCEFIPGVYYISSKNIEGSLVPYVIANTDPSRKNLIIGGELYDTQYSSIPNFVNHYIHRGFNVNSVTSDTLGYLTEFLKHDPDIRDIYHTFNKYNFYVSLMSVLGNKVRSIESITGVGIKTLKKFIDTGIAQKIIHTETTNPEILSDIFQDDDTKEEFVNNFYCSSILSIYQELTEYEKTSIIQQQVDRFDSNSLMAINSTKFYNYPIILESLLL